MKAPLSRRSDPISSYMAADRAKLFVGSHKERIITALGFLGQATPAEIGQLAGLTVVQVDRRLPELQKDHFVKVVKVGNDDLIRNSYRVWEAI